MAQAQHMAKFMHDDCADLGSAIGAAGQYAREIGRVKAHLARNEDQRLPGDLCIAAAAIAGYVSGKPGTFRWSRPGDQQWRPPFPVAVGLENRPVVCRGLGGGSVINELQAGGRGSCCHGFPNEGVATGYRIVRPHNEVDRAARIVGDETLIRIG